jgi:DNA-binding response OmpR family regulator
MTDNLTAKSERSSQILVVEDHHDTAEMLRTILEEEGYVVQVVERAGQALQLFLRHGDPTPDLMILDLTLPDMPAVDLITSITETTTTHPPIIVVSAKTAPAIEQAAEAVGATAVLQKPFAIEQLLETVQTALSTAAHN